MSRRRQAERLRRLSTGDKEADEQLYREVYRELLRIACGCLRGEGPEHTLQATASREIELMSYRIKRM
jgi:ECF sigma factor